uniref:Uncharacterized protein n=1 Tax=Rhizophora mucronata TaxID=61149 RepID=A0A2P2Q942_RHIMU
MVSVTLMRYLNCMDIIHAKGASLNVFYV